MQEDTTSLLASVITILFLFPVTFLIVHFADLSLAPGWMIGILITEFVVTYILLARTQ